MFSQSARIAIEKEQSEEYEKKNSKKPLSISIYNFQKVLFTITSSSEIVEEDERQEEKQETRKLL